MNTTPNTLSSTPIDYRELDAALAESRQQSDLYRPSSFWADAAERIVEEIKREGVERFRQLKLPLSYFVPTYGLPGNGFGADLSNRIEACAAGTGKPAMTVGKFLSGESWALADYRVFRAADRPAIQPGLAGFSESEAGLPAEHFSFDGHRYSRSSLNYLLGLCFLKRHLGDERIRTVLEIGGGFGSCAEILLKSATPGLRYIGADIPPNSFITQYYLSAVFGASALATHATTRGQTSLPIDELPPASALCNWQIEQLTGTVDLFINFISFQEMEPAIVSNYLAHVSRLKTRWVLLRNIREGKQLRTETSVGVEQPIHTRDYLDMLPDYTLVDQDVTTFGYRTVDGFHSELSLLRRKD